MCLQLIRLHLLYVKHLIHNVPGCVVLFSVQLLYQAATDNVNAHTHKPHTHKHPHKHISAKI